MLSHVPTNFTAIRKFLLWCDNHRLSLSYFLETEFAVIKAIEEFDLHQGGPTCFFLRAKNSFSVGPKGQEGPLGTAADSHYLFKPSV
jgi:hypothetical protein